LESSVKKDDPFKKSNEEDPFGENSKKVEIKDANVETKLTSPETSKLTPPETTKKKFEVEGDKLKILQKKHRSIALPILIHQ